MTLWSRVLLVAVAAALAALAAVSALAPVRTHAPGDAVFSGMQVHEIRLRFEPPAFRDSLMLHYALDDGQYLAASATLDGVAMDSVGVRFKGNSSYDHPNGKKPMRLSFGAFADGQRWDGLTSVHLNNAFGDPSFLRERLYYDLCRDIGLAAPRASYAAVYVNGAFAGLYVLVEHVDATFLAARFGDGDGVLFKAVDALGPRAPRADFLRHGPPGSSYAGRYELKSDSTAAAWPALVAVIDAANDAANDARPDAPAALGSLLDLGAFTRAMALDHVLANLDSYSVSGRNFYTYVDPATGRMTWIPWDVGLSLGGFAARGLTPETLPLTYTTASRPLVYAVFETPATRAAYLATARTVAASAAPGRLFPHIDSLVAVIRPYVATDPRKQYTTAEFEASITRDIVRPGRARVPGVKPFLVARAAFLRRAFAAPDGALTRPARGPR